MTTPMGLGCVYMYIQRCGGVAIYRRYYFSEIFFYSLEISLYIGGISQLAHNQREK